MKIIEEFHTGKIISGLGKKKKKRIQFVTQSISLFFPPLMYVSVSGITKTDYAEFYPFNYELVFPSCSLTLGSPDSADWGVQTQWIRGTANNLCVFDKL